LTYSVLELNKGVGRKMHTQAVDVFFLDADTRKLASSPVIFDRDFPEADVVAVDKGDDTGARTGVL
jgi:hypothetical protein